MKKIIFIFVAVMLFGLCVKAQYPDGSRIKAAGGSKVYMVSLNQLSEIENEKVYFQLYKDWNGIVTVAQSVIDGKVKRDVGNMYLAKSNTSKKVYLVVGDYKRWIESDAAFNRAGFDWDKIVILDDNTLNQIKNGVNIQ